MTVRSSSSDPLRVDFVQAGKQDGRVGMTLCPGKNQPVSMTGGWSRNLTMDLAEIRACGAQVLVSLMETQEFHSVAVSPLELSQQTRELGIEWIHTPIVDGSVPDDAFLEKWRSIALHLRESLDRGETIVFHCLGGLGRAGTMAACLLIETGFDPAAAIAAVRGARPGAIENKAQEDFVLSYAPMAR